MHNLSCPVHVDMHVSLASLDRDVVDVLIPEPRDDPELPAVTATILLKPCGINVAFVDANALFLNEFLGDSNRILDADFWPVQFGG